MHHIDVTSIAWQGGRQACTTLPLAQTLAVLVATPRLNVLQAYLRESGVPAHATRCSPETIRRNLDYAACDEDEACGCYGVLAAKCV